MTPRNSPGATVSDTSSSAVSTPSGVSNRLTMLSTTRMASAGSTLAEPPGARFNDVTDMLLRAHHWRRPGARRDPYAVPREASSGPLPLTASKRVIGSGFRRNDRYSVFRVIAAVIAAV